MWRWFQIIMIHQHVYSVKISSLTFDLYRDYYESIHQQNKTKIHCLGSGNSFIQLSDTLQNVYFSEKKSVILFKSCKIYRKNLIFINKIPSSKIHYEKTYHWIECKISRTNVWGTNHNLLTIWWCPHSSLKIIAKYLM